MVVTIHQPQYLPWLGYFDKADQADVFILLDDVQFKKNEWQNRNRIRTAQGEQWLTVPVQHNFGQKINEVKINNKTNWRDAHMKALNLNYAKTPHFAEYKEFFESVYAQEWELLSDLNVYLIENLIKMLGIETKIVKSSDYEVTEESSQRLIDLCKLVNINTYLSGRDGSNYMDFELFKTNGIKIITQDFEHPTYEQYWAKKTDEGFVSHMSVIDLLFNCGSKSLEIIQQKV